MPPNPYSWQSHYPRHAVPRDALVTEVVQHLHRGASTKIIGGRGMGKSVLLHQLEARLQREQGTRTTTKGSSSRLTTTASWSRVTASR
jgi:ABC-type transporter Mla maintaining outer membrane lipid asymmetry ATPase subunit MlaF